MPKWRIRHLREMCIRDSDYLIKVKDYGFVEAVEALTGGAVEWTPPQTPA